MKNLKNSPMSFLVIPQKSPLFEWICMNCSKKKDQEIDRLRRQIVEHDHEVLKWIRIAHIVEALKASHDATTPSHEEYELHPLEEKLHVIKMQIQHDKQQLIIENTILKEDLEHY